LTYHFHEKLLPPLAIRTCYVGVLSAAFLCVAHAGVIVDLGTLDLELGPDGRITRQLEVTNTDDKPAAISVFVADWKQDENGAVEAVDPSTAKSPESATGWIGVSPQRFVLGKREKKIVTVSFVMPKDAALMPLKEYRSMVFTETWGYAIANNRSRPRAAHQGYRPHWHQDIYPQSTRPCKVRLRSDKGGGSDAGGKTRPGDSYE
jgi:hypothetical protein